MILTILTFSHMVLILKTLMDIVSGPITRRKLHWANALALNTTVMMMMEGMVWWPVMGLLMAVGVLIQWRYFPEA